MTENYIPRNLLEREKYYQYGVDLLFPETGVSGLYDLITKGKKKIVLLGDAGHGKSTELKKVAERLVNEQNVNHIPVFVELDTYVDQEIKYYIIAKIGEDSKHLLDYSKSSLIFLFDEFDKVLNKEIATRKIKSFIETFNESTVVISCRTNFYSGQFEEFSSFVILPFDFDDVSTYAKQRLKAKGDAFLNQLRQSSLLEVSKNPFFLKYLTEIFEADNKLPDKLSDIISRFISISLETDSIRLSSKYDLKQRYSIAEIEKDLAYISLVMETLQKNYISIEEFNKMFPYNNYKRQVVTELSLIKKAFLKEGDVYQFLHNNFQEELAAEMLSDLNLPTILEFISYRSMDERKWIYRFQSMVDYLDVKPFGINIVKILSTILGLFKYKNNIKKIKPSWANTVAFLCLLRKSNDLLEYLMENEPELALNFETSRVDDAKKETLFKNIFEKYTSKDIPIDRDIDYEELAKFARTAGQRAKVIYDYLMNYARSNKQYEKYNAISMLSRMREFKDEPLRELLIHYAKDINELQSTRHVCFYALARLGMATRDTIDALKSLKDSNDDWILSGLYYLIKESEHVDHYVDILLSGIPNVRMEINSAESRLGDEAWNLRQGLEKVKSPEGVRKIVRYFIANPEDLREFHIKESMKRLVSNFIAAYNLDSSIYTDVKQLLTIAHKNYIDSEVVDLIIIFFKKSNTVLTLFEDIFEEGTEGIMDLLASIANSQCANFLLNKYNEGKITDENMSGFIHYLQFNSAHASLLDMINSKTGKFYPAPARDYKKEREEQLKRKVEIIFSKREFFEEVEHIFKFTGKNELTLKDIDDILHKNVREIVCNDFIVREIRNSLFTKTKNEKWTLDKVKGEINRWNYEWFTVSHVFNLLYHGTEIELSDSQRALIKEFCLKHLSAVNFQSALSAKDNGDTTTTSHLAVFLWYFFRKLDLDYPEDVLLDMLSYDWVEGHGFVGIDYLENKLAPQKVKQRILENLSKGISVDQVLRNHINYCKSYRIQEAKGYLHKTVENHEIKIETRLLALETIASISDCDPFLEKMLNSEELKLFSKAAEILMSQNSRICESKLIAKLSSKDDNSALEAARLLIEKQNLKALRFYVDYIKRTKKFSSNTIGKTPLSNIQTIEALPIIWDLLKFYYEYSKEIEQDKFFRLDSIVIGVLKNISRQNYTNFTKVRKQLQKFINKYQSRFENISYLNFISNDIEKDFYINFKRQITIDEAIAKVKRIA